MSAAITAARTFSKCPSSAGTIWSTTTPVSTGTASAISRTTTEVPSTLAVPLERLSLRRGVKERAGRGRPACRERRGGLQHDGHPAVHIVDGFPGDPVATRDRI